MRVTTLELFFDLVFVFTITQVTHLVTDAHGVTDLVRTFLVLAVTWWMYDGYAWLTNNVGTEGTVPRLLLLLGMAGFLVMAIATPHVAERDGLAFGLAYLAVVLVHAGLFLHAPNSSARSITFRFVRSFELNRGAAPLNPHRTKSMTIRSNRGTPPHNWSRFDF